MSGHWPSRAAIILAAVVLDGCGNGDPTGPAYEPDIPTQWAQAVTNPYFPLTPGTQRTYEGDTEDGVETIVIDVLSATRVVNGVVATVVRDRVYLDGELIEDTFDWFAQDAAGNVWYLGEDSKEIEDGEVVNTDGSWEWGVDGALPGIIMWADPSSHIGEAYRQEFYEGEAEDWGKVVAVDRSVAVPFGAFTGCIQTEDWSGLESAREDKFYCPQIGVVLEQSAGGGERVELIGVSSSPAGAGRRHGIGRPQGPAR